MAAGYINLRRIAASGCCDPNLRQATSLTTCAINPHKGYTLLSTVLIHVGHQDGKGIQCTAILDSGLQLNLICHVYGWISMHITSRLKTLMRADSPAETRSVCYYGLESMGSPHASRQFCSTLYQHSRHKTFILSPG